MSEQNKSKQDKQSLDLMNLLSLVQQLSIDINSDLIQLENLKTKSKEDKQSIDLMNLLLLVQQLALDINSDLIQLKDIKNLNKISKRKRQKVI